MYSYIQGKIVDKTFTSIVVDNNGIGYEIGVSGNTLTDVDMGEIVKIYTYLYVREDEMSLYGFSRSEEKKLFLRLIEISGIDTQRFRGCIAFRTRVWLSPAWCCPYM